MPSFGETWVEITVAVSTGGGGVGVLDGMGVSEGSDVLVGDAVGVSEGWTVGSVVFVLTGCVFPTISKVAVAISLGADDEQATRNNNGITVMAIIFVLPFDITILCLALAPNELPHLPGGLARKAVLPV